MHLRLLLGQSSWQSVDVGKAAFVVVGGGVLWP